MLEDYIQETILDQNKLAAGSDRYDKMRCCALCMYVGISIIQLYLEVSPCHAVLLAFVCFWK